VGVEQRSGREVLRGDALLVEREDVVRLEERVDDELPVDVLDVGAGLDVVVGGELVAVELGAEAAEGGGEVDRRALGRTGRPGGGADEDQAVALGHRPRPEPEVAPVETAEPVAGAGWGGEAAG